MNDSCWVGGLRPNGIRIIGDTGHEIEVEVAMMFMDLRNPTVVNQQVETLLGNKEHGDYGVYGKQHAFNWMGAVNLAKQAININYLGWPVAGKTI